MSRVRLRTALIVPAILVTLLAYAAYSYNETTRNAYTAWWAASMIIEHLDANDEHWPANWHELHDDYEICVKRSGSPWTFNEIRERVAVDFTIDSQKIRESLSTGNPPALRAIWLSDGTVSYFGKREPNSMILEYMKTKIATTKNNTEPENNTEG
jgi:hypothetical protein